MQLVGRILRVHRRLQGRKVPEILRYGYVLLADPESQTGIDAAGQRINQIQTAYATISPTTMIVRVGERDLVQSVGADGQMMLVPIAPPGAIFAPPPIPAEPGQPMVDAGQPLLFAAANAPEEARSVIRAALGLQPAASRFQYPLREDVPRYFKTQGFPEETDVSVEDCADHFAVSVEQLHETLESHDRVKVQKRTLEIFTREIQLEFAFAPPSLEQMQRNRRANCCGQRYSTRKTCARRRCGDCNGCWRPGAWRKRATRIGLRNISTCCSPSTRNC